MTLISPGYFWFASLIGVVLLLYVLRMKRKEHIVSSTLLWQAALRDLQANAPWQKLRSSLLMWLQVLFLVLAVLALVRPAIRVFATGGQTIAIVLDASGSMGATDVRPSRFDQARNEAGRLIGALSTGDQATLIAAGAQTRVFAPLTSDKAFLKRALGNATIQDTACNLREAIVLAGSLLRGKQNPQIYVLSDGAVAPITDLALDKANLQFIRIGQGNNNLAITAMDVRRNYSGSNAPQVFATVQNYSDKPQTVNVELYHDNDLVAVRPLNVPAGDQSSQLFEDLNFQEGLFSVRFDTPDDLKTDNVAYATLAPAHTIRVLLVSEGNAFLERFLGINTNIETVKCTEAGLAEATKGHEYDVVICDNLAPAGLPAANQLVFNTVTSLTPVTKVGVVQQPSVADWDHRHPVARYAAWNDIKFVEAMAVQLQPWGKAVVESERTPLVVAGERSGRRVVWCGFDLRDTDFVLRVAFPIFLTNTLNWLTEKRGLGEAEGAALRAGEPVPLAVPVGVQEVSVTGPDRRTHKVTFGGTAPVFDGADRVGVYTATAGWGKDTWKQQFAVNLLNKTESNLKPQNALQVGSGPPVTAERRARSNYELWGYVALAGLLLLSVEWWVYHRGV